jgi:hypothetical protein
MSIVTCVAAYAICQRTWMHLHIMTQKVKVKVRYLIATKDFVTMLQSWLAIPSGQVSLSGGAGRQNLATLAPEHLLHAAQ